MHLLLFGIQLFPDGTIFLHIAMILAMIWILNRTLYRPINRVLEAREKHKKGGPSEAASILTTVAEKEARYKNEMLDARSKGYEIVESEQKEAAEAREKEMSVAKLEVAQAFEKSKAEIEKQTAETHAAIAADADKNAESIAASILRA